MPESRVGIQRVGIRGGVYWGHVGSIPEWRWVYNRDWVYPTPTWDLGTVCKRTVRMLLECFFVSIIFIGGSRQNKKVHKDYVLVFFVWDDITSVKDCETSKS